MHRSELVRELALSNSKVGTQKLKKKKPQHRHASGSKEEQAKRNKEKEKENKDSESKKEKKTKTSSSEKNLQKSVKTGDGNAKKIEKKKQQKITHSHQVFEPPFPIAEIQKKDYTQIQKQREFETKNHLSKVHAFEQDVKLLISKLVEKPVQQDVVFQPEMAKEPQKEQNPQIKSKSELTFRFIRHAHDEWNDKQTRAFHLNPPLTTKGKQMCKDLGMHLTQNHIGEPFVVFVSPFRRCLDTAKYILKSIYPANQAPQRPSGWWTKRVLPSVSLSRLIPLKEARAYLDELKNQHKNLEQEKGKGRQNPPSLNLFRGGVLPFHLIPIVEKKQNFEMRIRTFVKELVVAVSKALATTPQLKEKNQEIWIITHGIALYRIAKLFLRIQKEKKEKVPKFSLEQIRRIDFLGQLVFTWKDLQSIYEYPVL